MSTNISLASVVHLIFNQCRDYDSELADPDRIIEFIRTNLDETKEEANQLQFNELFESLRSAGKQNEHYSLTKNEFERIFKQWVPCGESANEEKFSTDLSFFDNTQRRLSRSLTNLKQSTEHYQKINYLDNWCHWDSYSPNNIENIYNKSMDLNKNRHVDMGNESPHEDPFNIPLDVVRSTPIKKRCYRSRTFGIWQQPDLRHIKQYRDFEQTSFSDTETLSRHESSLFEEDSIDNLDLTTHSNRKWNRHKSTSSRLENTRDFDSRDLISQLRQIKFKNSQLSEINERLQVQLEQAEENIRILNTKYMDLEKKNRHLVDVNDENKQLIMEIGDIRKCVESEIELKRRIQSEKIMTEGELTAAKEHIQSLIDRLSVLDEQLIEKDKIIVHLQSMILQQEELCLKLQEINSAKEEELQKNQKGIRELTDAICEYEEKIQIISKDKYDLEHSPEFIRDNMEYGLEVDQMDETKYQTAACGKIDSSAMCTTQSEFVVDNHNETLWSIKLELAKELIDSPGDSPLCEKLNLDEDLFNGFSDDSSFQMLNGLLSIITSLRMTLAQYREQLESASRSIKNNENFSDEVSLSYLSYLNDSINLLNISTEKASKCQHQFNDTFNLLMKRISTLRNNNKTLVLQNEKLVCQIKESPNSDSESSNVNKIGFLEEELRKERLSSISKEKEIEKLKNNNQTFIQYSQCSKCGRTTESDYVNVLPGKKMESVDLVEGKTVTRCEPKIGRRYTFGEIETAFLGSRNQNMYNNKKLNKCSSSLTDLNKVINKEEYPDLQSDLEENIDQELELYRNYKMSTDNLTNIPRYKLSRANTDDIDIEGLIENTWLEPPSKLEERRASVFVQIDHNLDQSTESDHKILSNTSNSKELSFANTAPIRTRSSSCSSSNDTSDANSIDSHEERKKLAQQLKNQTHRHQSRSPATTLLNSSLVSDDLKSLASTTFEIEQAQTLEDHTQFIESFILSENNNSNGNSPNPKSEHQSPNSVSEDKNNELPRQRKESVIISPSSVTRLDNVDVKAELPIISIFEPSVDSDRNVSLDIGSGNSEKGNNIDKTHDSKSNEPSTSDNNDVEALTLQISLNKSNMSSCSSLITGEETKNSRPNSRLRSKRLNRPHTIAGINLNSFKSVQDDALSNNDEPSVNGDTYDIQEAIDLLNETSRSLILISPEELENRFSEVMLMYKTDRPTVIERALDANIKCNRALTNVEQEFGILRHLIKSLSMIVDHPCDLISRIKTSVNVLEKCIEYLSAKSEILGSVQQELKLSCLTDVMQEFTSLLQKQKENQIREIEELKNAYSILNDIGGNSSMEQARSKRSLLAGKDPKTRFQMVAQSTATKTSILRQLTNSLHRTSNFSATPDCSSNEPKLQSSRSSSTQSIGICDENTKSRKVAVTKFFPSTPSVDDNIENLYQKGLAQGLRINTDQALTDMRAQQSKFSSTLDALSDMIEECESSPDGRKFEFNRSRIINAFALKDNLLSFFHNLRIFFGRMAYVTIGLIVMIGLLIPWFFIPANTDTTSFSVPVVSRRRSYSFPDQSESSERTDLSAATPSLFLSNINVVRHNPPAV